MSIKILKDMTPEEEQAYIDKINDLFVTYLEIAPFVEIGDTTGGQFIKLRTTVDNGIYSMGEIIFELQSHLYRYKKNNPELLDCKLIVSDLQLTQHYPDSTFRRGLMIKMKYDFKELPSKQRFIEGVYIEEAWMNLDDFPEPPDKPRVATHESWNQWETYRKVLREFSDKQRKK